MSRYGRVIEAASNHMVALRLMALLVDKAESKGAEVPTPGAEVSEIDGSELFSADTPTEEIFDLILSAPPAPLTLAELDEVFDEAAKFAEGNNLCGAYTSGTVLERAFPNVLSMIVDRDDAQMTVDVLLPAFQEYFANKNAEANRRTKTSV